MSALPPTDVLVAYLEPIVQGARVVVVGSAESGAPELLLELGARSVHVFELDAARAKRVTPVKGVSIAMLPVHDFDVREGAFEVALVPDLSALPDPPASLARLRRVLGAEGTILAAAPNPESMGRGIGYYELYDLVALQFATVKMIAAVPFSGTTLAELGLDGQPDVSVDTQLAGTAPPPMMFCAVASQRDEIETSPYAIIQLPEEHVVVRPREEKTDPGAIPALESSLAEARLRIEALEGRIKEQASEHKKKIRDVEATLAEAQIRADQLEAELAEARKLDRGVHEHAAELEAAVTAADDRAREAEVALALARARAEAAEKKPEPIVVVDEDAQADVARLESQLRERATAFAEAENEIRRREAMVKELLLTVEQQSSNGAPDEALHEKLDALALELARRHGELEAARWRIAELEQRIARPMPAPTPSSPSKGGERGEETKEIDVLRQALVQEHEARTTAESGEALTQARAEVQRQAVLIDQLSRDPAR